MMEHQHIIRWEYEITLAKPLHSVASKVDEVSNNSRVANIFFGSCEK